MRIRPSIPGSALTALLLLSVYSLTAQTPVRTLRGTVTDADTRTPLPGANVVLVNSQPLQGVTTDAQGLFRLEKVPVGRQSLQVTYIGYKPVIIPEILVTTGKEVVLNISLEEEPVTAREVEIKATTEKDKPLNAMAMISARSFSVEESRRYAGSADDPMRAVSNFAGVAGSADISSNEIIVRGNSPKGLLWRVDGVDIPNPNHYAYVGTSGGGMTMFSSQVLSNSDFYTAAFPAEYGNALSGVFDMKFRSGNTERHEFALQAGIQGIDVSAEGPFSRKARSSYLFNYRYSILGFLQLIDPEMKNKIPSYQDLSFKINLPAGKAGTFSLVGIGGISRSKYMPDKDSAAWKTLEDRTQSLLNNNMGALALIHAVELSRRTSLRSYLSATYNSVTWNNGYLGSGYQLIPQDSVKQANYRFGAGTVLSHRFSKGHVNRTGFRFTRMYFDSDLQTLNPVTGVFGTVYRGKGNTDLIQAYSESKIDLGRRVTLTAGLDFQWFLLNRHYSVEPRVAVRWQVAPKHALSAGYGKHSQTEDAGLYLSATPGVAGEQVTPNRRLDFSKAHHFVVGYDFTPRSWLRFKTEIYYQYLCSIPVVPGSYLSLINSSGGYWGDSLVNDGTGRNAGIDLTFEKFLTKGYYYLVTVSLFDSKYRGGDGIERNTRFNTGYVVNLLGGKEWMIRKKNILGLNLKASATGGEWYVPIDAAASAEQHREILDESKAYREQLPAFFYLDLTVTYRTNHRKFSGTWALQLKNLLNSKPTLGYMYNDFNQSVEPVHSTGLIPFISYKIEF